MARVLLVAGTKPPGTVPTLADWWHPASAFVRALQAAGHALASPDDPFSWTQDIDGLVGDDREWQEAGKALRWYLQSYPVDAIIAHSHGGNVVALALAGGAMVDVLITVATPVRPELAEAYSRTRDRVGRWTHLRSDGADRWQRWGSRTWADWLRPWRWGRLERDIAAADCNVFVPGIAHGALMDPRLWTDRGWWGWLGSR